MIGTSGEAADLAAEFVALVRSDQARQVFDEAGFGGIVLE